MSHGGGSVSPCRGFEFSLSHSIFSLSLYRAGGSSSPSVVAVDVVAVVAAVVVGACEAGVVAEAAAVDVVAGAVVVVAVGVAPAAAEYSIV